MVETLTSIKLLLHQIKAQQFYTSFPVLMSPISADNL